jgi:hypothetical protein
VAPAIGRGHKAFLKTGAAWAPRKRRSGTAAVTKTRQSLLATVADDARSALLADLLGRVAASASPRICRKSSEPVIQAMVTGHSMLVWLMVTPFRRQPAACKKYGLVQRAL